MNAAGRVQRASELLLHIHSVQDHRRICQHHADCTTGGKSEGAAPLLWGEGGRRRILTRGKKSHIRFTTQLQPPRSGERRREDERILLVTAQLFREEKLFLCQFGLLRYQKTAAFPAATPRVIACVRSRDPTLPSRTDLQP